MAVYKVPDISAFPDCCALSYTGRCRRLTLYYCQGKQCSFKQTHQQETDSEKSAYERLASLDIFMQVQIAKKYYDGAMPWNKEFL